ncbi:MAG TPA: SpoIIE family protein phosphatase [Chloroflexia bacterium]|nr:SpoIIE family protein phosphatase [Chloroflexia bacterium]
MTAPAAPHQLLILADRARGRGALAAQLDALGYTIDLLEDADQARAALADPTFDLLLLDIQPPQLECAAILAQRKADPRLRYVPVILLAERQELAAVEGYLPLGADDYLTEPFTPALLQARLAAYLERRRLITQMQEYLPQLREMEKLTRDLTDIILPLGAALAGETNFDRLLERILVEAKAVCNADAGTLYLRTRDDALAFAIMRTDSLRIAMGGTTGQAIPFPPLPLHDPATGEPNYHNVATAVALTGRSINIPDIYHAQGFDFSGTKVFDQRNGYRSVSSLTVPLTNHLSEVIGVLQLLNAQEPGTRQVVPFTPYLQQVVESLAAQAAVVLNNQILLQSEKKLLSIERDIQIGQRIQASFLPDELPQAPGWEIAAVFHPAREVSGDFYDVFTLARNRRIGLVIADVCDKGVGAAIFMALFRSLIRAFAQRYALGATEILAQEPPESPADKRRRAAVGDATALKSAVLFTNNYVARNHSQANMFATLFFGVLDPASGLLTYVNGGHEPPVLLGAGGVKAHLTPTGPAVGMLPDMEYTTRQVEFAPGDVLVAFTDGVTEARGPDGGLFGDERLYTLLEEPTLSAAALLARVEADVRLHTQGAIPSDDITMLAVRRGADAVLSPKS